MMSHNTLRYVKLQVARHHGLVAQHASRHIRDARAVMHAGLAKKRCPLKSVAV